MISTDGMTIVTEEEFYQYIQNSWSMTYEYKTDPVTLEYTALVTGFGPLKNNGHVEVKAVVQRAIVNNIFSSSYLFFVSLQNGQTSVEELL